MSANPFETDAAARYDSYVPLLFSQSVFHFDGMMPTDIYNQLGLEAVIRKDERVEWLVSNCLQRGYIEPVGDTGRINMTACGHQLCLSGDRSYCSGLPSYKQPFQL